MSWLILIIIGIGLLIAKGMDESTRSHNYSINNKNSIDKRTFNSLREEKYKGRFIDNSRGLFERNTDIIEQFKTKIKSRSIDSNYRYNRRHHHSSSPGHYYIENQTRDCINEIALAENNFKVYPGIQYLSDWKSTVPVNWQELAIQIETNFRERQQQLLQEEKEEKVRRQAAEAELAEKERQLRLERWEREETLKELERNVKRYRTEFNETKAEREDPTLLQKITKRKEKGDFCIEDIDVILAANLHPWGEIEKGFITKPYKIKLFPLFSSEKLAEFNLTSVHTLNSEINKFNEMLATDTQKGNEVRDFFKKIYKGYSSGQKETVIERFNYVLSNITLPPSTPKNWDIDFDPEEGILVAEIKLPDVVHNQIFKEVALKSGKVKKPVTLKEQKEIVPNIHPAIMLRVAYEIFRNDDANIINLLVLNGWVEFDDPSTGNLTRTYTASLVVKKDQIKNLKLSKLDPIAAFAGLKGKSAGRIIDIVPVEPTLSLNKKDKRFIEAKEVLSKLGTETNLASMDWQDFEHLIREMFEKEFEDRGAEVKITQSSRDRGVDAVVFDPDPIHGGRYVIQAKRYTNTVDVSAVRDLCAVVRKEGASRGILVTTSNYGADAYAFAQGEPVTLLNGAELLGLLKKHGYSFRIDLREAKKLNAITK